MAACKEAVEAGYVKPLRESWAAELRASLDSPDGEGGETRLSFGKRAENATSKAFGESISDNAIAIKYGEYLRESQDSPERVLILEEYWTNQPLQDLAVALWKALQLPMRGDVARIPFSD